MFLSQQCLLKIVLFGFILVKTIHVKSKLFAHLLEIDVKVTHFDYIISNSQLLLQIRSNP